MFTFQQPTDSTEPKHELSVFEASEGKVMLTIVNRWGGDPVQTAFMLSEGQITLLKKALDSELESSKRTQKIVDEFTAEYQQKKAEPRLRVVR